MSESASSDDEGRRVVAARLGRDLPEVLEPVLGAPARGVGGIDRDHRHTVVRRHLDEPVPKLACREPGDEAAEALGALAP
jgi:hypothetical protein